MPVYSWLWQLKDLEDLEDLEADLADLVVLVNCCQNVPMEADQLAPVPMEMLLTVLVPTRVETIAHPPPVSVRMDLLQLGNLPAMMGTSQPVPIVYLLFVRYRVLIL